MWGLFWTGSWPWLTAWRRDVPAAGPPSGWKQEHDQAADADAASACVGEAERVGSWRFQQLVAAGWPDGYAVILASLVDVDLHVACDLLARGCSVDLAYRILS